MKKLLVVLSFFCVLSVFAAEPDPRIKGFLDELDIKYETKDVAFIMKFSDATLIIPHEKVNLLGVDGFNIIAVVDYNGDITHDMKTRMLDLNFSSKIGFWALLDKFPSYKIVLNNDCSKEDFALALLLCLGNAENFEKKIVRGE